MLYIVGIGPGHKDYIIPKVIKTLENSNCIIGFHRAIESLSFIDNEKIVINKLNEILEYINHNKDREISIAASGDPCFYGITDYIKKNYQGRIEVITGISSYQYMMSKLSKSWQGSFLGSVHGREEDFIKKVRENEQSIWLTDSKNNPSVLCEKLVKENIKFSVTVGENLSYEDEKITEGLPEELKDIKFSELSVVYINRSN